MNFKAVEGGYGFLGAFEKFLKTLGVSKLNKGVFQGYSKKTSRFPLGKNSS